MIIDCQNVAFTDRCQAILTDISFTVKPGDSLGIVGPSGSGKSTLLRLLNLSLSPTAGTILFKGKPLEQYPPTQLRRQIGYVLQKPYLFGESVRENLYYPYQLLKQTPNIPEIMDYLSKANLSADILDKKPSLLSGGEQQRLALIRSLLVKPEVLLVDEITAALDEVTARSVEELLETEKSRYRQTLLFITHNKAQAARLAKDILELQGGLLTYYGAKDTYFSQEVYHE